jgi:hypothetical protein
MNLCGLYPRLQIEASLQTGDLGQPSEVALSQQAQIGDRESLNALMERHDGMMTESQIPVIDRTTKL